MKKGYLYLIFLSLFTLVVLGIALIYKLVPSKGTNINITASTNEPDIEDIHSLVEVQNYKDSWIQKISKTDKQKEYIYPVQKFYIEFN
jgi:hypothetical protein